MASINYKGVEADNEHMACSDHFTTAWWVMLVGKRGVAARIKRPVVQEVNSVHAVTPRALDVTLVPSVR